MADDQPDRVEERCLEHVMLTSEHGGACVRPRFHAGTCHASFDPALVIHPIPDRVVPCCARMDHGGYCVLPDGHDGEHDGLARREGPEETTDLRPQPKIPHEIAQVPGWIMVTAVTCPTCRMHTPVSARVTTGTPGIEVACPPCGAVVKIVF